VNSLRLILFLITRRYSECAVTVSLIVLTYLYFFTNYPVKVGPIFWLLAVNGYAACSMVLDSIVKPACKKVLGNRQGNCHRDGQRRLKVTGDDYQFSGGLG